MGGITTESSKSHLFKDLDFRDDLSIQHPRQLRSAPEFRTPRSRITSRGDDADDALLFDIEEEEEVVVDESGGYRFKLEHCAQCHAPGDFFCGRCCDAPSSARLSGMRTSYCSTSCQTLHLERHQPACNILEKRKALSKVAEILCSIWGKVRTKAYPFNVTQIRKEDGALAVHQGDERRNMNGRIFFDAPDLTSLDSAELREQILLMGSSRTSVALLHIIVKELFLVLELGCDYIKEITVPVEDPIVHYDSEVGKMDSAGPIAHVVFEIGLRDAESWILDMTAAAIGHDYSICPWREWIGMTEQGYDEHQLGHQAAQLNHVRSDMNLAFIYTQIHYLSLKMIPERFKTKLESTGVFLKDMHKVTDEHFPYVHANVLRHLDLATEDWVEFMALPQTMDDIGSMFEKVAISTMGEQAVREDLKKIKDRGKENRVGVEHEILRIFRAKRVLSEEDKVIHDVLRDIFFA
ncbi:set domain-containing protein 5 [Venturia nashicola]|nr:set domain-containing protein 5 [Venturia nashicola]